MNPFIETLKSKEELFADFKMFANRKQELGQNALLAHYGLCHGSAIMNYCGGKVDDLMNYAGIPTTSIAYFQAGIRAWNNLNNGLTELPLTIKSDSSLSNNETQAKPLQQIFYGAPGTGKSHTINVQTKDESVIRTTFHPDSDYSTFVGAYKPTSVEVPVMIPLGDKVIYAKDTDGRPATENRIVYEFVPQAFLQAYVKAWELYAKAQTDGEEAKKQYLVIEEINRGNCAQIFGDLFQLLDRRGDGFSEYPINADKDLQKQLAKLFADLPVLTTPAVGNLSAEVVAAKVRSGEILVLPSNLYIWATMNTSDQSLFPIDSAFKRRWDWKYVPINEDKESWQIEAEGKKYSWSSFLHIINQKIQEATSSEDKMLGFYFCKAKNGIIDAETFVGKVVFYLWNDVFKDNAMDDTVFDDEDGGKLEFRDFYDKVTGKVVERKVTLFLQNLQVELLADSADSPESLDELDKAGNNFDRYSLNGSAPKGKSDLGLSIMTQYIEQHPNLSFEEIRSTFPDTMLGSVANRGLIVKAGVQLDSYVRYYTAKTYMSADGVEYKIYKQWIVSNVDNIIQFANSIGWNVEKTDSWQRKDNFQV